MRTCAVAARTHVNSRSPAHDNTFRSLKKASPLPVQGISKDYLKPVLKPSPSEQEATTQPLQVHASDLASYSPVQVDVVVANGSPVVAKLASDEAGLREEPKLDMVSSLPAAHLVFKPLTEPGLDWIEESTPTAPGTALDYKGYGWAPGGSDFSRGELPQPVPGSARSHLSEAPSEVAKGN